jgi:hypothetical protein
MSIFGKLMRDIIIVTLCGSVFSCQKTEKPSASEKPAAATKAAVTAAPDWNKIKGRWLRPDGGYILEVRSIAEDGRAEANYFNPNPIRVAWARAASADGTLKLEVELRDVNYPGCLYKLTYAADGDQLTGTYFQAQMQETHQIVFVREK